MCILFYLDVSICTCIIIIVTHFSFNASSYIILSNRSNFRRWVQDQGRTYAVVVIVVVETARQAEKLFQPSTSRPHVRNFKTIITITLCDRARVWTMLYLFIYVCMFPRCSMYVPNRSDSPRSTRSAPWGVWSSAPTRGLYSSSSPRSVRSGPHQIMRHARRSSSVDSQSSNDSRSCRKYVLYTIQ